MLRGHKKDQGEHFFSYLEASHDNMVVAAPGPSGQGVEGRHALWPELWIFAILKSASSLRMTLFRHGNIFRFFPTVLPIPTFISSSMSVMS